MLHVYVKWVIDLLHDIIQTIITLILFWLLFLNTRFKDG